MRLLLLLFVSAIVSCNVTKNVPKDDALYTGATVKIKSDSISKKMKKTLEGDLTNLTRPRPNSKLLGIPIKLTLFNLAGNPNKKGFIRKFLRKFGEPPVLLSDLNLENNNKILRNYLENRGYFQAGVSGDTSVKSRKAHATYTVETGPLYTIKNIAFPKDTSTQLGFAINGTEKKSLIKPGVPFNLDLIKGERSRIDAALKEEGFYFFSPDNILVDADTSIGDHKVNLYVTIKTTTASSARKPYLINEINVYPNYSLSSGAADTLASNAEFYKGYYIVDNKKLFKPKLFENIMQFKPNDVYSRKAHNLALNRLINLGVYKFVKNRFEVDPYTDELNTFYYLTPLPKKTLRAEFSGNTQSNNNVGSLVSLSWRNKNFFGGAELLNVSAYVGSELQYSGTQNGFNTNKAGGEISLTTPKFIFPFLLFNTHGAYVPKSYVRLGYDLLNRSKLYTLNSFKADLGYTWKPTERKEYRVNPISIDYVQPLNITQRYLDSIHGVNGQPGDLTLQKAIEKQFVIGSNFTYTYNELVNDPKGKGWFFIGNLDLSGGIVSLFAQPNLKKFDTIYILGAPFSQYAKTELDVRHYSKVGLNSIVATRVDIGIGIPYGNSYQLPYVKQFFIGGTNSLRGFRSRSLGPGIYRPANADSSNFFADQSGDIKLEMNAELRQKITGIIEGALFVDAGNIWLKNKDANRPGAEFTKDFLKQLAVDAGIGLRFDLQILLLRLDVAMPLVKPWLQGKSNSGSSNNVIFNIGIGYPF